MVGIVRTITRVNVIASNVFREVLRDRVLYFLVFYAAALLLGNWMLPHIAGTGAGVFRRQWTD
jgi:Cu-processing system permease protein